MSSIETSWKFQGVSVSWELDKTVWRWSWLLLPANKVKTVKQAFSARGKLREDSCEGLCDNVQLTAAKEFMKTMFEVPKRATRVGRTGNSRLCLHIENCTAEMSCMSNFYSAVMCPSRLSLTVA